jgi:hypothetical protein
MMLFRPDASYFLLLTSCFLLLASYFSPHTGTFAAGRACSAAAASSTSSK